MPKEHSYAKRASCGHPLVSEKYQLEEHRVEECGSWHPPSIMENSPVLQEVSRTVLVKRCQSLQYSAKRPISRLLLDNKRDTFLSWALYPRLSIIGNGGIANTLAISSSDQCYRISDADCARIAGLGILTT